MENNETIGKRIQRLRKEKGLTQEQLASELGITAQAVSKWENDYSCPDISVLSTLAKVLGVGTDELLNGNDAEANAFKEDNGKEAVDPDEIIGSGEKSGSQKRTCRCESEEPVKKTKPRIKLNKVFSAGILFGLFVIVIGVAFIINGYFYPFPNGMWGFIWPVAALFIGLGSVFSGSFVFGIALLITGAYFVADNFQLLPESFSGGALIIAVIIIAIGVSIIIKIIRRRRKTKIRADRVASRVKEFTEKNLEGEFAERRRGSKTEYSESDGHIRYSSSFSDDVEIPRCEVFYDGEIANSFGSMTVNLCEIVRFDENATLNINTSFGETNIIIPKTVKAHMNAGNKCGSVDYKGSPNEDAPYNLCINGNVSFGTINVTYKM